MDVGLRLAVASSLHNLSSLPVHDNAFVRSGVPIFLLPSRGCWGLTALSRAGRSRRRPGGLLAQGPPGTPVPPPRGRAPPALPSRLGLRSGPSCGCPGWRCFCSLGALGCSRSGSPRLHAALAFPPRPPCRFYASGFTALHGVRRVRAPASRQSSAERALGSAGGVPHRRRPPSVASPISGVPHWLSCRAVTERRRLRERFGICQAARSPAASSAPHLFGLHTGKSECCF